MPPLNLTELVAKATPATLVQARTGAGSTPAATLDLVKDRTPHALPCTAGDVPELRNDLRKAARQLDMGVSIQVQRLDGSLIPTPEVKDLIDNTPKAKVQVAFLGGDRTVRPRKPKENAVT